MTNKCQKRHKKRLPTFAKFLRLFGVKNDIICRFRHKLVTLQLKTVLRTQTSDRNYVAFPERHNKCKKSQINTDDLQRNQVCCCSYVRTAFCGLVWMVHAVCSITNGRFFYFRAKQDLQCSLFCLLILCQKNMKMC